MKVVVAPDSFKECLTSIEVSEYIEIGVRKVFPEAEIIKVPISDGGEGLLDALIGVLDGKRITTVVQDPLFRKIEAEYGVLRDGCTAVIEMAKASGLELLKDEEKNPMITSSFGTGQLIKEALDNGCNKIIIGIGGSATNDGGVGMVKALGGRFLDKDGKEISVGGGGLASLSNIDLSSLDKRIIDAEIVVACDVTNPLTGVNGASKVYGGQKGGDDKQLNQLDVSLMNYASVIRKDLGIEIENLEGAGAAGGMGAGLISFLGADLKRGIDLIIESLNIEESVKDADLVITGEGKIDIQSSQGKAITGLSKMAKNYNVPVIAIAGKVSHDIDEVYQSGVSSVFSIVNEPMSLEQAFVDAPELIVSCIRNVMEVLNISSKR